MSVERLHHRWFFKCHKFRYLLQASFPNPRKASLGPEYNWRSTFSLTLGKPLGYFGVEWWIFLKEGFFLKEGSVAVDFCLDVMQDEFSRGFSRWWFQIFFYFHPYLGKIPILTNIFQMGWNHQPVLFEASLFCLVGRIWRIHTRNICFDRSTVHGK